MTENQLKSHQEQMEAARREFENAWETVIWPRLSSLWQGTIWKDRDKPAVKHASWVAWKIGKGIE